MRWILPLVAAELVAFSAAADTVLDLGDLDQYKSQVVSPYPMSFIPKYTDSTQQNEPSLDDNTVWLSQKGEEGYHVGLSKDLKAKIAGVLDGCGKMDDKCHDDIDAVLSSAHVQIDPKLEGRHFGHKLSKAGKGGVKSGAVGVFLGIMDYLQMAWKVNSGESDKGPNFAFIPASKADEVADVAAATGKPVVISGGGKGVATITPKPDPNNAQGYVISAVLLYID